MVPLLQHQIAQQENALSLLLGSNPGEVARSESFSTLTPLRLPSQLPSSLLNRRPDIVQAERQRLRPMPALPPSGAPAFVAVDQPDARPIDPGSHPSGLLDNPLQL